MEGPSFFSMYAENFDPRNDGFLFSLHSRAFLSFRPVSLSFRAIISLVRRCHGSTKFEAFIECLRTEDRPQPPPRLQASFSLSLSFSFRSDFPLSLSPPTPRLSLCPFFSAAVLFLRLSIVYIRRKRREACAP